MQISTSTNLKTRVAKISKTNNRDPKSRFFFPSDLSSKGFTLIEILVAMFLMAMVIVVALTGGTSGQNQEMEEAATNIERSVRFGMDEAALRNVVVRVHFELNKEPQEFSVQYGPNAQFIPPPQSDKNPSDLVGREKELYEEQSNELTRQFNRIRELQEDSFKIYQPLKIIGVGLGDSEQFIFDGEASLYLYPTGEKDHGAIILANDVQILMLTINPFSMDFERDVYPIQGEPEWDNIISQAQGYFQEWLQRR